MVDDFIHNLRSGKDKRYDRGRRQYSNPQYKGQDRQTNYDRRRPHQNRRFIPDQMQTFISETMPAIKSLLETISENQKRLAEAEEMRASAEDRKAEALERIAVNLQQLATSGVSPSQRTEMTAEEIPVDGMEKPTPADREKVIQLIREMRDKGATYPQIAAHLESRNTPTFSGKGKWHAQTVHKVCQQND